MNEKNLELLKKFENELNIIGYSQKTIETYLIYLTKFSEFIKRFKEVNSDDIVNLSYLKTKTQVLQL